MSRLIAIICLIFMTSTLGCSTNLSRFDLLTMAGFDANQGNGNGKKKGKMKIEKGHFQQAGTTAGASSQYNVSRVVIGTSVRSNYGAQATAGSYIVDGGLHGSTP